MRAYAGRQFVPFLWWSLVWPGREGNSRPTVREADTLPTEPTRHGLLLFERSLGSLWYDYVLFVIGPSSKQFILSLLQWLNKLSVLKLFHLTTMNHYYVKLNWRHYKRCPVIRHMKVYASNQIMVENTENSCYVWKGGPAKGGWKKITNMN